MERWLLVTVNVGWEIAAGQVHEWLYYCPHTSTRYFVMRKCYMWVSLCAHVSYPQITSPWHHHFHYGRKGRHFPRSAPAGKSPEKQKAVLPCWVHPAYKHLQYQSIKKSALACERFEQTCTMRVWVGLAAWLWGSPCWSTTDISQQLWIAQWKQSLKVTLVLMQMVSLF